MNPADSLPSPADEDLILGGGVKRAPLILVLDSSASMRGNPIKEVNDGVHQIVQELAQDEIAAHSVELAVVSFGGSVILDADFATVDEFLPPTLKAAGNTPMGEALITAARKAEERHQELKRAGQAHFVPWIWLITDGAPTDEWERAAQAIKEGDQAKRWVFFAVGTASADFNTLRDCASPERPPLRLLDGKWPEMFQWLTASQLGRVRTQPGQQTALPPSGWGAVPS